jgi:hypothetical protein
MPEFTSIVIFLFCLLGCGCQAWYLGRREGIAACLVFLEEQGLIEFTEINNDE